jgi:hypothetical protein
MLQALLVSKMVLVQFHRYYTFLCLHTVILPSYIKKYSKKTKWTYNICTYICRRYVCRLVKRHLRVRFMHVSLAIFFNDSIMNIPEYTNILCVSFSLLPSQLSFFSSSASLPLFFPFLSLFYFTLSLSISLLSFFYFSPSPCLFLSVYLSFSSFSYLLLSFSHS